jgi:hypothetical protein
MAEGPPGARGAETIVSVLGSTPGHALLAVELRDAEACRAWSDEEFRRALDAGVRTGCLQVVDPPVPDPHLGGVDLRVVASAVEHDPAEEAVEAQVRADRYWAAWLGAFLADHRCE